MTFFAHPLLEGKGIPNDKGMLLLLVFGILPMVHTDDPARSVLACFDMVTVHLCGCVSRGVPLRS
jgi:hypothetical protein